MKKIVINVVLTFFVLFLVSCTSQNGMTKDIESRTGILYEHTIQMEELSSKDVLTKIGLDMNYISKEESLSTTAMVIEMESAYGIKAEGDYTQRIKNLEDKMNEMMGEWTILTYK